MKKLSYQKKTLFFFMLSSSFISRQRVKTIVQIYWNTWEGLKKDKQRCMKKPMMNVKPAITQV